MSTITEAIKAHHGELAATIAKGADSLSAGQAVEPEQLEQFVAFLKTELLPHAQGEEAQMYPAVEPLVREHGKATATMSVDHEFVADYVRALDAVARAWRGASATERAALAPRLARLAIGLDALFKVHLEKEERVYLPLFEQYLTADEQQRVLDGMHETGAATPAPEIVDVRRVAPPQRHPLIFGAFEHLSPSQSFELVNDHDPKPLFYQFQAELTGQFNWEYLERGPEVWRVRIGRN